MSSRRFTPATARTTLVSLRPALDAMLRLARGMEATRPPCIAPEQLVPAPYYRLCRGLAEVVGALHARGILVRDPLEGILDLPARRNGRPVHLCFRVGEDDLAFWHEPGEGLEGRRPVGEGDRWD